MRLSRPALRPWLHHAVKPLVPIALLLQMGTASAYDADYLRSLLDPAPVGSWVKASTNLLGETRTTGSTGLPEVSLTHPGSVVQAWSSVAWDSKRGQMYLWGGGHASYMGNDMRVWSGQTGQWSIGALPSRIQEYQAPGVDPRTWLVVDNAAPQASHTYDGNQYLPVNDYFLTLGDAVYNTGQGFQKLDANGQLVKAGPWLWDPNRADANKVGGTTGSGYDARTAGGNMWVDRQGQWTGSDGAPSALYTNNTSAYRTENGRDVVYLTKQSGSSGWPDLYRYTLGDVRNGGLDKWEKVGVSWNVPSGESTATIDDRNNLYVQTTFSHGGASRFELHVWDLDTAGAGNKDIGVQLVDANGQEVRLQQAAGIGYSDADGGLWLWDGVNGGKVWRTEAAMNPDGTVATTWIAQAFDVAAGAAQPTGSFKNGVFGKWQYASELGAFIALDEYSATTNDAGVWFYKVANVTAPVPEAGTLGMMLVGLAGLGFAAARRRRAA